MERVIFAGYNSLNRKIIPWHPQLEKLAHITKIQAAFNSDTKKFRVLKKVAKSTEDDTVTATVTAQDIKDELAKQEEAKKAREAEEQLSLVAESEDGVDLEEIIAAAEDKPKKSSKFAAPKVGL